MKIFSGRARCAQAICTSTFGVALCATPVAAETLEVCETCELKDIQSAIDEAKNGDVIEIAAGTYPGQKSSVRTIAQPTFLACRSDLPVDVVYKMTRAIYQNLGYLQNIHSATNGMRIDKAIEGLAVPLHPGAIKYYREQGVTIPSSLVVDTDPQE